MTKIMTPEEYTRERPADLLHYVKPRAVRGVAKALERGLVDDIKRGRGEKHKSAAGYQAAHSKVSLQWRRVLVAMNKPGRGDHV